ncbi:IS3 family transposase [Streptomyces sp. NBC_01431]|uniref:IS3 family transposase n=1 Tax=Streptomyces sp. NBC_01431 TaxID=2903863 RepID=UPI003FCEC205
MHTSPGTATAPTPGALCCADRRAPSRGRPGGPRNHHTHGAHPRGTHTPSPHPLREHQRRDAELTGQIRAIHAESGGIYGSPRVHAVLKREGARVGRKRVERLMREAALAGISPRRGGFTRRDPKATLAPDLVNRNFTAPAPNRLWVHRPDDEQGRATQASAAVRCPASAAAAIHLGTGM